MSLKCVCDDCAVSLLSQAMLMLPRLPWSRLACAWTCERQSMCKGALSSPTPGSEHERPEGGCSSIEWWRS
eukprot:5576185-Alexandrium_andersonii.AAC.1